MGHMVQQGLEEGEKRNLSGAHMNNLDGNSEVKNVLSNSVSGISLPK